MPCTSKFHGLAHYSRVFFVEGHARGLLHECIGFKRDGTINKGRGHGLDETPVEAGGMIRSVGLDDGKSSRSLMA